MYAEAIIRNVKRRLVAMAEDPPYTFVNTPPDVIERHHKKLTTFVGYSEAEVAQAESRLGVQLPAVFRTYLLEMGRSAGELFCGSDLAGVEDFDDFRSRAQDMMWDSGDSLTLPREAVVFFIHHDYTFLYILATGGFDSPVFQYVETHHEFDEVASSLSRLIESELELMENTHKDFHETGGYYMTLNPDSSGAQSHPALDSGDRPLDQHTSQSHSPDEPPTTHSRWVRLRRIASKLGLWPKVG